MQDPTMVALWLAYTASLLTVYLLGVWRHRGALLAETSLMVISLAGLGVVAYWRADYVLHGGKGALATATALVVALAVGTRFDPVVLFIWGTDRNSEESRRAGTSHSAGISDGDWRKMRRVALLVFLALAGLVVVVRPEWWGLT